MTMAVRKKSTKLGLIRAWVRTTTYSAQKIATHFGVSKALVHQMCLQERPWLKQQ